MRSESKKILVLSQDPRACQAITTTLANRYSVFATPCRLSEAARFISKMRPAVLICDRALLAACRLDAIDVAADTLPLTVDRRGRAAASDEPTATLTVARCIPKVIALLNEEEEGAILECFERGADDYVFTPILGDELRAKVEVILESPEAASAPPTPPRAPSPPGWGPPSTDTRAVTGYANRSPARPEESELDEEGLGPCPTRLGRFDLLQVIGRGGYGVVYRARDRSQRGSPEVALKVLPKSASDTPESVARFFRESSAIARLNHTNVVRFFEFDTIKGRYFFTMELVEGIDLKELADREAPFALYRAANMIIQVARGLAAIASLGYIHRDVKPENMIVCRDGTVKLIDFGLVKIANAATITNDNDVLGTPYYMGPEYIAGGTDLDARYDLYSLGVTFYVFLVGQYPFVGRNTAHVLEKHLRQPPPRVSDFNAAVPPEIDTLIARLLSKNPADRPPTPFALIEELERVLGPAVHKPYPC